MKPLRAAIAAVFIAVPLPAHALFHYAVINEVMASYDGDDTVQFVEIRMLIPAQIQTQHSLLSVFNADGSFGGVLLELPGNVAHGGIDRPWIMGTSAFAALFGHPVDFTFPAGLMPQDGMVCWGAPATASFLPPADPDSWDHTVPNNYVDCLAYGSYTGSTDSAVNKFVGTPAPIPPSGHSLQRIDETDDNAADFTCAETADPTNNALDTASLVATTPCPEAPATLTAAAGVLVLALARRMRGARGRGGRERSASA